MGKQRGRKLFLGTKPIGKPTLKSRREARKVTSQYHSIIQQQQVIEADHSIKKHQKKEKLSILREKLDELGGIDRYQQASIISTQHFKTSKWVTQILDELGMRPKIKKTGDESHPNKALLRTLEVGAINTQLKQCSWMDVRAIDLNTQYPGMIEEIDFFDIDPDFSYDVVVCSMVNFHL